MLEKNLQLTQASSKVFNFFFMIDVMEMLSLSFSISALFLLVVCSPCYPGNRVLRMYSSYWIALITRNAQKREKINPCLCSEPHLYGMSLKLSNLKHTNTFTLFSFTLNIFEISSLKIVLKKDVRNGE